MCASIIRIAIITTFSGSNCQKKRMSSFSPNLRRSYKEKKSVTLSDILLFQSATFNSKFACAIGGSNGGDLILAL